MEIEDNIVDIDTRVKNIPINGFVRFRASTKRRENH